MSSSLGGTIDMPVRDEAAGRWHARLVVDDSDTVIFDHSVDHVPAMLMLHGIAELIERASPAPPNGCAATDFDLTFTRFVEKDCPALVSIDPGQAPGSWRAELTQSGETVCAGTVGAVALTGREAIHGRAGPATTPATLADAALVHRLRPENIVVSPLRTVATGYVVDYVPSEAVRTKRFEHIHCPLDVVEAARQFMILLSHAVCGLDLGISLILDRLTVHTPRPFPRAAPVRLYCPPPQVKRHRLDFSMRADCGDAPSATIGWDIRAASPAVYARLRRRAA